MALPTLQVLRFEIHFEGNGCDSIVTADLIIGSSIFTNFNEEGCDSVFTNGQWFLDTVLRDTFCSLGM